MNKFDFGNKWLIGVTLMFFCEVTVLSFHLDPLLKAPALYWVLVVLATIRLAHTLSFNGVAQWIRAPFTDVVPDSAGGSEGIEAKPGNGLQNLFGQLLECPICSGTWSAMFLLTVYCIRPELGWAFAMILGVAGGSEMLHWVSQYYEWAGRRQREDAGTQWLLKNKGTIYPTTNGKGHAPIPEKIEYLS